jgi:hypothetical protein
MIKFSSSRHLVTVVRPNKTIPPPLNPHNRQVDDCVVGEEKILIEGVEVEVEAEEVAEYVGVGKKNYEEPGPRGSAGDFLLDEEMEGDPPEREVVEGGELMFF